MKTLPVFFFLLALSQFVRAQDGTLDASFGNNGIVKTDFGNYDKAYALDVQSDGKIIVAGTNGDDFLMARYNTNGTLDVSFDNNGYVTTDFGGSDCAYDVLVLPDGKILAAGIGYNDFAIAKYNTDGSLDGSFGTNGKTRIDIATNSGDEARGIAINADGKIFLCGSTNYNANKSFTLIKLDENGNLDTNFGNNGKVITDMESSNTDDVAYAVKIQSDGKIVVAGAAYGVNNWNIAVARYNTDGTLDGSFNADGKGFYGRFDENYDEKGYDMYIQSDGKIVVVGYSEESASDRDFLVIRCNSDGFLDNTFSGDGMASTDFDDDNDIAYGVTVQADGKIIAAGYARMGTSNNFGLVRFNADGSVDNTFGTNGLVTVNLGSDYDYGQDVILQTDDKIVVAGYSASDLAITRHNNTVTVPVELVSFNAAVNGNSVTLNWQTATEVNNYGFQVERQKAKGESSWENIGFVEGAGNSNSPKVYSFTDNVTKSGTYSYRLKQIDIDGSYEYSEIVEVTIGAPAKFELMQNYPNPFNPTTTIKYSIPSVIARSEATKQSHDFASNVQLNVYNILGEEIATLVNKKQSPGTYTVQFDASNLPSGVYIYKLKFGKFSTSKKMLLLK